MYTHKFEIEFQQAKIEGELDFENPTDGIKFTDFEEGSVIYNKCLRCITEIFDKMKKVDNSSQELVKFTIELID